MKSTLDLGRWCFIGRTAGPLGLDGVSNTVHPGRAWEAAAAGVRQGEELGVPRAAAGVVIRECGGRRAAAARPVVQG